MSLALALALRRIDRPRILICGDFIHDHDVHCVEHRFAQEAPHCPVWKQKQVSTTRPGGAGAVYEMCKALGADVCLASAVTQGAGKTRYFIGDTQVLRIDRDHLPIETSDISRLVRFIEDEIKRASAVLIPDYGKGVCTDAVLRAAIDGAKARGIPCIVDPAHGADWMRYMGVTCIKCNEVESAFHEHRRDAANDYQIVTLGARGMLLHELGGLEQIIECRTRRVLDVTGAGDMVLVALGVCVSSGMSWPDACKVANAAAGLKCERRGAVPVPRCEVIADLLDCKIVPDELLTPVAQAAKLRGKVVWSNGCMDGHGLHRGHLHSLAEAKKQGDVLIVGVNGDRSVAALKGPGRPISPIADRLAAVVALACVDYVVEVQDDEHLLKCLQRVAPDVLVKGDDWRGKDIVGVEHAGRVHFVERLAGYSTTRLAQS